MGLPANTKCPRCDTKADVQLVDGNSEVDRVVKANSEEVVMEICCKEKYCYCVWKAVYAFSGQETSKT